jgi:putative membrane protein
MKRLTFDVLLAASMAIGPAAWAQPPLPGSGDPVVGRDAGTPSTAGAVPGPSQRRERNTTATTPAPDDPEKNGRTGYPPGAQSAPDTTSPYNPGPTDTTKPYSGSPERHGATPVDDTRGRGATPIDDTNAPAGKGTAPGPTPTDRGNPAAPTPGRVGDTTTPPTTGAEGTTGTRPGTTADDASRSNSAAPTAGTEGDVGLVTKVHQANQKEIEMAQMALDKAESPKVKAYARKLLTDHQAADKKLMAYAEKKNLDRSQVEATATGTTASPTDEAGHKRLMNATGTDFDREFVNMMIDEHDKAIDLVKSGKDAATDKQLRTMLGGVLPKLEQHRKMAHDLADKQTKS